MNAPLVSCVMPTFNRRAFVPGAIECFRNQTYANRELVIVDDGTDPIGDLVLDDPSIRYVRLDGRHSTGAKRNAACRHAEGEFIAHWDDDDWSAPDRLAVQIESLLRTGGDVCGLSELYFHEPRSDRGWRYRYPSGARPWVAGGTMCYRRGFWERHPFPDVRQGEDTQFVWADRSVEVVALDRIDLYVATIHAANTSAKRTSGHRWSSVPVAVIRAVRTAATDDRSRVNSADDEERGTMPSTATVPDAPVRAGPHRHVTVSIPHRGDGSLLRVAVESVLAQTHRDLTCVVVLDGDDFSGEAIADLDDERLCVHRLAASHGRYFADQVVLDATSSTYFLVQDSDDWSDPTRLARLLAELELTGADVCVSDAVHHDRRRGTERRRRQRWPRLHDPVGSSLVHRAGHQGLYRTDMLRSIGGWYAGWRIGYDTSILNLVLLAGGRIVSVDEPLYHRSIRDASLSTSPTTGWNTPERRKVVAELRRFHAEVHAAATASHDPAGTIRTAVLDRVPPDDRARLAIESACVGHLLGRTRSVRSREGTSSLQGPVATAQADTAEPAQPRALDGTSGLAASRSKGSLRTTAAREPVERSGRSPETLVVITTFDRPDGLGMLLDDIEAQAPAERVSVIVFDDASTTDSGPIETRLRRLGWRYVRASTNHGKRNWWRWWNTILAELRASSADRFIVLQDDIRLCSRFFDRIGDVWRRIDDDRKVSLFLHVDDFGTEPGGARWTSFREVPAYGNVQSGWVDLTAFVCERRMFEALDWALQPVGRPWRDNPNLGSGVGAQISSRLFAHGHTMYRVCESLVVHADTASKMNPVARAQWPIHTRNFVDGEVEADRLARAGSPVLASLASVPTRERQLEKVVERLLPQVDRVGVFLNGYERVPDFLVDDRIAVAVSQVHGDLGDAGKFHWAEQCTGYVATCDDDMEYPTDYVAHLIDGIERYERRAAVGFHGATLHEPLVDYYRSRHLFHFSQRLASDTQVHVLGTGVAGYHASTWHLRTADFPRPDMADIYMGLAAQDRNVPLMCLRHGAHWLCEQSDTVGDSIYERAQRSRRSGPSEQTVLAQRDEGWKLHPIAEPRQAAPPGTAAIGIADGLGAVRPVRVRGPRHRAVLMLPESDHITMAIQQSGTYYEADLLDRIRDLQLSGTFVDVGAHYGNHSLYFAIECEADHVVAIEPNTVSARSLIASMRQNGVGERVTTLNIAIHPTYDRVEVTALPWSPRGRNAARTNSGRVGVRPAGGHGRGHVAAQRLDDALAPFDRIALIKIDTEDISADVLASAGQTLERYRPVIAVEAATEPAAAQVAAVLRPLGYELVGRFCWTPTWLWLPTDRCA